MRAEPNRIQGESVLGTIEDTFFYSHNFGDAVHNQVFAAQSQCGAFAFGENYHVKVVRNYGFFDLKDFFLLIKPRKINMIHWPGNLCVPAS